MVISTTFIESIAAIQSIHLIQIWGIRGFCLSTCVRFFVRCIVFLRAASTFCVRHRLFVCGIDFLCAASLQIGVCSSDIDRGVRFSRVSWL